MAYSATVPGEILVLIVLPSTEGSDLRAHPSYHTTSGHQRPTSDTPHAISQWRIADGPLVARHCVLGWKSIHRV